MKTSWPKNARLSSISTKLRHKSFTAPDSDAHRLNNRVRFAFCPVPTFVGIAIVSQGAFFLSDHDICHDRAYRQGR